jgi:hypothetical protein
MNNTKTNPIGLDAKIQRLQTSLFSQLNTLWNLTNGAELDAYGRCYVIDQDSEKTVRFFKTPNEYQTVSVAERNKFFFIHRSIAKKVDTLNYETTLELILIVEVVKLKPTITHRADIEVQADVELILNQFDNVWVESLEIGYENALRGIVYSQPNDMQPYHVFKYNLNVRYNMNEECNCCV